MNLSRAGIYNIENLTNGKLYIGSAVNLRRRKNDHWAALRKNNRGTSNKLQNAWNKHGEENFRFNIIEFVDDVDSLIEREQYWLDYHKTYERGIGYNTARVAGSNYGCKPTEETRLKISQRMKGRSFSDETRLKISMAKRGRVVSDETKLKISLAQMGNTYSQGERNALAVLTENDVFLIHWLLTNPDIRQWDIARRFGVKRNAISRIATGKAWKHLNVVNEVNG